jgi:hypothetical protein
MNDQIIEAIVCVLAGEDDPTAWRRDWFRAEARHIAPHVIAAYERIVPSDRLTEILAARRVAVHDLVQPSSVTEGRWEARACEICGEPIEPGEAYNMNGPAHARHKP